MLDVFSHYTYGKKLFLATAKDKIIPFLGQVFDKKMFQNT